MIQVYSAGTLAYDSRLNSYGLIELSYKEGLNKAGTATIKMPPGHPAYEAFPHYKPIVNIYENGILLFRGRPLKPQDDFYNRRTITCEGERCFFLDAAMRPYLYQATPEEIFRDLVEIYNSQVEEDKRFVAGTVTVTDDNDYVRLESQKPEQVGDTLDKLVNKCGGYIVFTTNTAGDRVVNWYDDVKFANNQVIAFGENLTNFSRATENPDLATRIVPYGAKDEETGEYVTIESINNGIAYVEDEEAIALRGIITKVVIWEDVTTPEALLRKAKERLATLKNLITSINLTSVDLSRIDKTLDSFRVGDYVRVKSKPHGVDEFFLVTDRSVNLLDAKGGSLSLGKEVTTLTGIHATAKKDSLEELQKTEQSIRADYTLGIAAAVESTEQRLSSMIEQSSESIKTEVSKDFITNDQLTESVSTSMEQFSEEFRFEFETLQTTVDDNDAYAREKITEVYNYISFKDGNIVLGTGDSAITLVIMHDRISFQKSGVEFGYWNGTDFYTGNIVVEVNERAQFGNFAFIPRSNGSLSFLKVGG